MTFTQLKNKYKKHPKFNATDKRYKFEIDDVIFYDNHEIADNRKLNGKLIAFDVSFEDMSTFIKQHFGEVK